VIILFPSNRLSSSILAVRVLELSPIIEAVPLADPASVLSSPSAILAVVTALSAILFVVTLSFVILTVVTELLARAVASTEPAA